jgi:hypothetical protein
MRAKPLKTRDLILSPSKDEAKISCFFSSLLVAALSPLLRPRIFWWRQMMSQPVQVANGSIALRSQAVANRRSAHSAQLLDDNN